MPVVNNYSFADLLSFTRATAGWRWTSAGVLEEISAGAARFDHDPIALAARGVLVEEAATNGVSNPRAEGAVAGTPGTIPTGWQVSSTGSGLTRTIVGTGTEDGIPYVDIRFAGTASVATTPFIAFVTTTGGPAALVGETWTLVVNLRLVAGALPSGARSLVIWERSAAGAGLASTTLTAEPTSAALRTQRFVVSRAFTDAAAAFASGQWQAAVANAEVADFTMRIGAPMLVKDDIAFSPSLPPVSTPGASTRNADNMELIEIARWFNATAGTFVIDFTPGQTANGSTNRGIIRLDDGTATNRIFARMLGASTNVRLSADVAGVQVFVADQVSGAALSRHTLRFSFGPAGWFISVNGAAPTSGAGAVPAGLTRALLGRAQTASEYLNGWIGPRVEFYPTQYTDTAGDDGFTIRTR